MRLEIIERGLDDGVSPPLLFVHGFWQAAWCWDVYVMPELGRRGHHCVAVSLTGHGGSEGRIRGQSVDDHVADVVEVASRFDRPPVLIGHSMGGFVVQHYLAGDHPAAGAVLVAPVPRPGAWGATPRLSDTIPASSPRPISCSISAQ